MSAPFQNQLCLNIETLCKSGQCVQTPAWSEKAAGRGMSLTAGSFV